MGHSARLNDFNGAVELTSDQGQPEDVARFINGLTILVFCMASAIAPNDPTGVQSWLSNRPRLISNLLFAYRPRTHRLCCKHS
jgi:hypothetical protein